MRVTICMLFAVVGITSAIIVRGRRQLPQYITDLYGYGSGGDGTDNFTKEDLDALVTVIRQRIEENPQLIPDWVQLSFHDCFGPSGCNGCLDRNHPANLGLLGTIDDVVDLHQEIGPKLSLADFIALLGTQAAKAGAEAAEGSLDLTFSIGRKDCSATQPDTGLPVGHQIDTIQLLKNQFTLSTEEAVALIGAHSLGRARSNNTGFSGPWDRSELKLDAGYYNAMTAPIWEVERVNNSMIQSSQWVGAGQFMMLHADMILLKKFTPSGPFREPECTFQTCPDQERTAGMVRQFRDQTVFHEVFSRAFLKMITKTQDELTLLE